MRNNNVGSTYEDLHAVFVMKMGRKDFFQILCEKYINNKERFLRINYMNMNVSRDQFHVNEEPGSLPLATRNSQQQTRQAKTKFSERSVRKISCILYIKRPFVFNAYSHSYDESGDSVQSCPRRLRS
jgi:hypothetical protein